MSFSEQETGPDAQNATPQRVAFSCLARVTGPPGRLWTAAVSTVPAADFLGRFPASLAVALAGHLLFFGLSGVFPAACTSLAPSYIAINVPFMSLIVFSYLTNLQPRLCLDYGREARTNLPKDIETLNHRWHVGQ